MNLQELRKRTTTKNINILAKEGVDSYKVKHHKPWLEEKRSFYTRLLKSSTLRCKVIQRLLQPSFRSILFTLLHYQKMTNYMGSTVFLLVVRGMRTAATDTINLLQKIGLLSIQKASSKRNISYYTYNQ